MSNPALDLLANILKSDALDTDVLSQHAKTEGITLIFFLAQELCPVDDLPLSSVLRRLKNNLLRLSDCQTVCSSNRVNGRILWPQTIVSRSTQAANYFWKEKIHTFNRAENQILKFILNVLLDELYSKKELLDAMVLHHGSELLQVQVSELLLPLVQAVEALTLDQSMLSVENKHFKVAEIRAQLEASPISEYRSIAARFAEFKDLTGDQRANFFKRYPKIMVIPNASYQKGNKIFSYLAKEALLSSFN